jgi:hypothetical protein
MFLVDEKKYATSASLATLHSEFKGQLNFFQIFGRK